MYLTIPPKNASLQDKFLVKEHFCFWFEKIKNERCEMIMFKGKSIWFFASLLAFTGLTGFIYLYKDIITMNPWMILVSALFGVASFIGFFAMVFILVHIKTVLWFLQMSKGSEG